MTGELLLNIGLVILFVLIGGVFAATEMALVTLRDSQINTIAQRGARGQKVAALARNPNTFLSAVQIGVTVAGFASAAYGASSIAPAVVPVLEDWGVPTTIASTTATIVLTLLIAYLSLVLGELAPKRLAIQRNAQFAYVVAPPLGVFASAMRPVIWLLSRSTNAVVRILGGDPNKASEEMSDEELRDIVSTHEGLPEDERRMLDDVLSLRGREISEVMRPRPEVVAVDGTGTVTEAAARVQELPYSRYPVTDSSIDDIIGFVHVRDLFDALREDPQRPVTEVMRHIEYYPATARVLPTLTDMRKQNHHIAVVVDEYGGTDGIVTLEDIIEEVVGEIFDEYDAEAPVPGLNGQGGTVDGRLNLADFEEATGIELPQGTYDTVAGFVVERLGRIPVAGDVVRIGDVTLRVDRMDRRRVADIAVVHEAPATEGTEGSEDAGTTRSTRGSRSSDQEDTTA